MDREDILKQYKLVNEMAYQHGVQIDDKYESIVDAASEAVMEALYELGIDTDDLNPPARSTAYHPKFDVEDTSRRLSGLEYIEYKVRKAIEAVTGSDV